MREHFWRYLFACVALLGVSILPAKADTLTFNFTSDHCTALPPGVPNAGQTCLPPGATSMGTVTVTDVTGQPGSIDVTVHLSSGFGFVTTGAGTNNGVNASFFFNLTTSPTITYSNVTSGWSIPGGSSPQQSPGAYAGDGLRGDYAYALACVSSQTLTGACGSNASTPYFGDLNFRITGSNLSANSFLTNTAVDPFAADVVSTTGATGLIDASQNSPLTRVPEPASLLLLGSGLSFCAIQLRRRK